MRGHLPLVIDKFKGLWLRGRASVSKQDSCPIDHFQDCNNIQFVDSGFRTRDGIIPSSYYANVLKIRNYVTNNDDSVLVLDNAGNIYHTASPTPLVPILTVAGMTDFGFISINARAYLSPSNGEHGIVDEFVYVYNNDGVYARKAAGLPPVDADGMLAAANSGGSGNVEPGLRVYGVVYETDSGFLTKIGPDTLPTLVSPGGDSVDLTNIPVSPSSAVIARHIVSTRAIVGYNGNQIGYQFFFVPGGEIADNTTTTLTISFFDDELLSDASHLLDILSEIPAVVGLTTYHNRMVAYNFEIARVSQAGEPEAFDAIVGLVVVPKDSKPLTNAQEFRDILYLFKNVRTFGVQDNGDDPINWPLTTLDQGIGASQHGVATVLQTGGVSIEFVIIINYAGIYLFSGIYNKPELSYKINDYWVGLNFSDFLNIEIYNDSIRKILYIILPDRQKMLIGDYRDGLDYQNIRWAFWTFDIEISSICLLDFNTLLIGSRTAI